MGEIVGAALVSHVPPIVLPEAVRLEINNGRDTTLRDGLFRMRRDHLDALRAEVVRPDAASAP